MRKEIRERLQAQAEPGYRDFSQALIPESKPLLGVRLPALRKIAKEIGKGDWRTEITVYDGEYEDLYFEETMLRGMVIGYGTETGNVREGLTLAAQFIPHIDNWSVCDSFCNTFGLAGRHRAETWEFLQPYLHSDREFEMRVGLITLLCQYLKLDATGKKLPRKRVVTPADLEEACAAEAANPYLERILKLLNRPYTQGYYAQMAAAWTAAEAFVMFPHAVMRTLETDCRMDPWTYRKTLQKICESRNPEEAVKARIRSLKRNQ